MPKYRFLTTEELAELENEFKQFLITNHLYDEEWAELNKANPEKAIEVAGLFSDLVLDKVFESTKYLMHYSPKKLKFFLFQEKLAILIGLDYEGELEIPENDIFSFIKNNISDFYHFTGSKSFKKEDRNQEIYGLVKAGAQKIDQELFDFVQKLK